MASDEQPKNGLGMLPAELLASTRMFAGLAPELLDALGDKTHIKEFPADSIVFRQGDPGHIMYVVLKGIVKVFVTSEDGDEMVLVDLRPCESFGELAILDGQPRSASVQTIEPCVFLTLDRKDLLDLMRGNPVLMEALLRGLGSTIRRLTEHTSDLVFLDLHERVSKLLIGLMQERGEPHPEGTLLDLPLTLSDLASVVGGSKENVHEILRSFQQFGYLELLDGKVLIRDATRLHQAINEGLSWAVLAQRAFHDPLTNLANRMHFDERIVNALGQATLKRKAMAVLIIDLDDFKRVNDSLGHKAGDELLIATADRLRTCIRQPDTAARLGGDEFGLLLAEVDSLASAEKVAARVVAALDTTSILQAGSASTTASVGIAYADPDDQVSASDLIERADAAMYEAKRGGKRSYVVWAASTPPSKHSAARAAER